MYKIIMLVFLLCNSFISWSDQVPKVKNKINLGSCEYLDYYLYNCLSFSCSFPVDFSGYRLTASFNIEGRRVANSSCNLSYKFNSRTSQQYPMKITCALDDVGIYQLRKLWYEYISGKGPGITESPKDPNLVKQCSPVLDYGG
jgi:hypothetical protein